MREDGKPSRAGASKSAAKRKKAVNLTIDAELLSELMREEPGTWCYERVSSVSPLRVD